MNKPKLFWGYLSVNVGGITAPWLSTLHLLSCNSFANIVTCEYSRKYPHFRRTVLYYKLQAIAASVVSIVLNKVYSYSVGTSIVTPIQSQSNFRCTSYVRYIPLILRANDPCMRLQNVPNHYPRSFPKPSQFPLLAVRMHAGRTWKWVYSIITCSFISAIYLRSLRCRFLLLLCLFVCFSLSLWHYWHHITTSSTH